MRGVPRWRYHRPGNAAGLGLPRLANSTGGATRPSNKGMQLTRPGQHGALQLIPSVRPTACEGDEAE